MPLIPSEELHSVIEKSRVGVWVERLFDGRVALVSKAPLTAIKAVYCEAQCSLTVSVIDIDQAQVLCLGLRIQDEPENPYVIIHACASSEEHRRVKKLLTASQIGMYFFDELCHPSLEADCTLQALAASTALEKLNSANLYSPPLSARTGQHTEILNKLNQALNLFQEHVFQPEGHRSNAIIMSQDIPLLLAPAGPLEIFDVSPTLSVQRQLGENEGPGQERAVYLSLDAINPGQTFLTPRVQRGNSERELIDILSFDYGGERLYLIESKALSVLGTDAGRPSSRRSSSVESHISKALNQLCGAITRIRAGDQVLDSNGLPLTLPDRRNTLVHAIVLLSELYAFVDWREIGRRIIEVSNQERYGALFHVLDLQELRYLVEFGRHPHAFDSFLMQRWQVVNTKGTAYVRAQAPIEFSSESKPAGDLE